MMYYYLFKVISLVEYPTGTISKCTSWSLVTPETHVYKC